MSFLTEEPYRFTSGNRRTKLRKNTDIRLFVDVPLMADATLPLDRDQSHYLATVMRLKIGDSVSVFNGQDGEWQASIDEADRRRVTLKISNLLKEQLSEPDLWLVFAPIKKARLDFIAQKATELGVSHLVPVMTNRTIVDRVNTSRLTANAIEAAEQCERLSVPTVGEAAKLGRILENWPPERKIMFCDEDLSGKPAHAALTSLCNKSDPGPWAILIGPEGGFDNAERALIRAHPNCVVVSLGPRVLRADTAAMAAISLWQSALGDW